LHGARPVIRVSRIRKTCNACPSQWEGVTPDGAKVYVRYRWGGLSVGVGAEPLGKDYGNVLSEQIGDSLDGVLSFDDLKAATAGWIEWPETEERRGDL
jgi:hypothetical protein